MSNARSRQARPAPRAARPGPVGVTLALALASCQAAAPPSREPLVVADISMSIAELETIRQANPEHIEVGLVLGERYRQMGMLDDAEVAFERVRTGAAGAADLEAGALGGLGLVAQSRDDLDLAETQLLEALRIAEAAGLEGRAREQRRSLAVLERVRGDFLAACDWYARAGEGGARVKLTSDIDCGAPRAVVALAASIWRANASETMEGLAVEARETKVLAAEAEAAVARGEVRPGDLALILGEYSTIVLYTEGAEPAEAVARRAIALDPRDGVLQLYLIAPLILEGRHAEADAAAREVIRDWPASSNAGRGPWRRLSDVLTELREAGLHDPHMDEIEERFRERGWY